MQPLNASREKPVSQSLLLSSLQLVPLYALHMLQFYLTAREREEFAGGEYPLDVVGLCTLN
jgi:hypothetical protein